MAQVINSVSDFDGVLRKAGDKLVVIDFTAMWCGPCKAIAPVFESLAKTHAGNAHFLKVDVDQQQALAQRYSVHAMPTFLFMRQGNVLDTLRGANAGRLQSLTQQYIKGGSGTGSAFSGSGQTIGGTTVAPGSGLPNGGIFGQIPMENMMPFLIVIGYLAYVVYNNYIK